MNIALSSWAKWLLALLLGVGLATGVLGTTGAQAASASASTPPAINALSQAPGGTTTMVAGPPAGSGSESGLVGNILPSDGVPAGTPSDGQYEVMYSTGGGLFAPADVGRQATGMFTQWLFTANVWVVHAALWLVNWALTFHVADALAAPAESLAAAYQADVVGPLGLVGLALLLCFFTSFWYFTRGRGTKALGEVGVSLLVLTVTACTWAQPSTLLLGNNGVLGHVRDLATGLASITTSISDGTSPGEVAACQSGGGANADQCTAEMQAPLLGNIHAAFVDVPYQLLNWGRQLDVPGQQSPCLATEAQVLAEGPWGTSNTPRDMMDSAGCSALATFNADPSADRLIGALLCLSAALLLFLQAILVAGATILAELTVLALVVVFPFVVPAGLLPGGGRDLLWSWVTRALKAMIVLVATCVTLSLMLVTISSLIQSMSGDPLFEIFIALNAVVVGAIIFRGRLTKSLRRIADQTHNRMSGARFGGSQGHRWLAPAAVGFAGAELFDDHRRVAALGSYAAGRAMRMRKQLSANGGAGWPGPVGGNGSGGPAGGPGGSPRGGGSGGGGPGARGPGRSGSGPSAAPGGPPAPPAGSPGPPGGSPGPSAASNGGRQAGGAAPKGTGRSPTGPGATPATDAPSGAGATKAHGALKVAAQVAGKKAAEVAVGAAIGVATGGASTATTVAAKAARVTVKTTAVTRQARQANAARRDAEQRSGPLRLALSAAASSPSSGTSLSAPRRLGRAPGPPGPPPAGPTSVARADDDDH
jgi:hypothetical protein